MYRLYQTTIDRTKLLGEFKTLKLVKEKKERRGRNN
jgi:hypothetical protein